MRNVDKIVEALVFIEWHMKEQINAATIANEIGYSTSYFRRLFKKTTNLSVEIYLLKRRLTEALKEIAAEPENVFRIAYDYRFSCYNRFTKLFFKYMKVHPHEIKKGYSYKLCPVQEPIVYDVINKISK